MQRSQIWRWGACVVLALLMLSAALTSAQMPIPFRVNYNTAAETLYTSVTTASAFDSSMAQCMANGLNLFSGESATRARRVYTLVQNTYGSAVDYSTYTSVSAKKTALNTICSYPNTASSAYENGLPNPFNCFFTVQWGLYSRMTLSAGYGYQPGLTLCTGLYPTFLNGRVQATVGPWESGFVWDTRASNPNGQNYTIINTGATQASAVFANIAAVVPANFYLPPAQFVTACEAQTYMAAPPQTFNATQPAFVKGYKDLTWVQEHWWVLFLIIAVVILIILFAILIFCCVTSVPPKEGPPIAPMVLRERNGQAYVIASDDDSTPKSRNVQLSGVSQRPSVHQQYASDRVMPMMPVPVVNPEDLIQATPSIYSQDDVMQTAAGDSAASDDDDNDERISV